MSTKTEIKDITDVKRRHGRVTSEQKPSIVFDYNKYMGGIDTFDMMLYSYLDERRTVKYWKKVAFNMFARMITNAYVSYIKRTVKTTTRNHCHDSILLFKLLMTLQENGLHFEMAWTQQLVAITVEEVLEWKNCQGKRKRHALFVQREGLTSRLTGKEPEQYVLSARKDAMVLASRNISVPKVLKKILCK